MASSEITEKRWHERELRECRRVLSLVYNGAIPHDMAVELLSVTRSSVLAEIMLDTFDRVSGCFAFNETFIDSEETEE